MSKIPPDDFEPTVKNMNWALNEFNITQSEVDRQTELFMEHEFTRHYTHWHLCWRRWMRKADELNLLKRPHIPRTPEQLTEEQIEEDRRKGWEQINRLKAVK